MNKQNLIPGDCTGISDMKKNLLKNSKKIMMYNEEYKQP
jgi:hypothetical protein